MEEKKGNALRTALMVLLSLAVLTAVEFGVSRLEASAIALFIIAMFKGGLILYYFMHIAGLFSEAEDH